MKNKEFRLYVMNYINNYEGKFTMLLLALSKSVSYINIAASDRLTVTAVLVFICILCVICVQYNILTPVLISASNKSPAGETTVRSECFRSMEKRKKSHSPSVRDHACSDQVHDK